MLDELNKKNIAFIDGQNLYLGTKQNNWRVDYKRLRIYLLDKYEISKAYYFLGFGSKEQKHLYGKLIKFGFILIFKSHSEVLNSQKKGNVDCDIVFEVMKNLIENKDLEKVFIISGDGDYKKLVDYLIKKNKLGKILFPNSKSASSLYKTINNDLIESLDNFEVRNKIKVENE